MANNFLKKIEAQINNSIIIKDETIMAPYLIDWRGNFRGNAKAILMPTDTQMVSTIMQIEPAQHTWQQERLLENFYNPEGELHTAIARLKAVTICKSCGEQGHFHLDPICPLAMLTAVLNRSKFGS